MSKKRDFSNIGKEIFTKNSKPSSLSDLIGVDHSQIDEEKKPSLPQDTHEKIVSKNLDHIIRECISIYKTDVQMVNELSIKCAVEGQKTTKADVYRAAIRYFSKLSPTVMASKIREVRKDKKTHNEF